MRSTIVSTLRSPWTLAASALLVGIAIVWDGAGAQAFNGIGGLVWVACAVAMVMGVRGDRNRMATGAIVLAFALIFAVVVRPSDGLIAVVAFGIGGACIAYAAHGQALRWSVLLPAIWLPVHLTVAIARATYRALTDGNATVRTDPPPTTAVVPLLMVLAAWGGGWLVMHFLKERKAEHRTVISRA